MIASRLASVRGRSLITVDVVTITGTVVYNDAVVSHQQVKVLEATGPLGEVATVVHDLFYFDLISGVLPAVVESHRIQWGSANYEVISARSLNELAHRLRVETRRVR